MPHDLSSLERLAPAALTDALITPPEDQWLDRKSGRVAPKDLAKTIVAMGNAEGGLIALGLANREPDAIQTRRVNDWRQTGVDLVRPAARVAVRELIGEHLGAAHTVVVLEVARSEVVLATASDEVYLRIGDEDRRLTFDQRRELLYDKGQTHYEALPVVGMTEAALAQPAVEAYAQRLQAPDATRALMARGVLTPDGKPTVAAAVCFSTKPDRWLPQAVVRVLRFRGNQRLTGVRQNLVSDRRFSSPLGSLIGEVSREILEQIPTRRALTTTGVFATVGLVPESVWLEALVNAVIHRSYSNAGDHIRVEIYDDSLVVESPGRLPGVVDLSDPADVRRYARNPRIARVAAELDFAQELGEGVRRMYEDMSLAGLVDPEFFQTAGSLQVVLSGEHVDRTLESRLPAKARALLQVVRTQDHPSTGDVMESVGMSRPAVIKLLRALEDEGLVERVGKSATDPRAFWRIRDVGSTLNNS